MAAASETQCVLDDAEQISAPLNSTLIQLGHGSAHKLQWYSLPYKDELPLRQFQHVYGGHTFRTCLALNSHAYAIRRHHAAYSYFFDKVREAVARTDDEDGAKPKLGWAVHPYSRYSIDISVRNYYTRRPFVNYRWTKYKFDPLREWPRCIDLPELESQPGHMDEFNRRCNKSSWCSPYLRPGACPLWHDNSPPPRPPPKWGLQGRVCSGRRARCDAAPIWPRIRPCFYGFQCALATWYLGSRFTRRKQGPSDPCFYGLGKNWTLVFAASLGS